MLRCWRRWPSVGGQYAPEDGLTEDEPGRIPRRIQQFLKPMQLPQHHQRHGQRLQPDTTRALLQLRQGFVGHPDSLAKIRDLIRRDKERIEREALSLDHILAYKEI